MRVDLHLRLTRVLPSHELVKLCQLFQETWLHDARSSSLDRRSSKIENARSETRVFKTQRCVYCSLVLVLVSVLGCVLRTRVPKIHS